MLGSAVACSAEAPNEVPSSAGSSNGGSSSGGSAGSGGIANSGSPSPMGGANVGGVGGGSAGANAQGGAGSGGATAGGAGGSGGASGAAGAGGNGGMAGHAGGGAPTLPFVLTSPAFDHVEACAEANHQPCEVFPNTNVMMTIGGQNQSPELSWGPGPAGTQSYAIVLHDYSNGFTHWAMWNIPGAATNLAANLARQSMPAAPAGATQKSFSKEDAGYMGPGAKDHVYEFRLYALSKATFSPASPNDQVKVRDELEKDAAKIVLGKTELRGRSPN